jgi:hypothetical protein
MRPFAKACLAALLGVALIAASPPKDLNRLFSAKPPWEFPKLPSSAELERAARDAIRNYRTVQPEVKVSLTGIYHDPGHRLAFLTFGIAKDSPVFETDFFLVYVYDRSAHRLLGHVFINMA